MYKKEHIIISYVLTVEDLEELTTIGGDEKRSFSDKQVIELGDSIQTAIDEAVSEFLSHN